MSDPFSGHRKIVLDAMYNDVKAADMEMYTKVVAATAAIADSFRSNAEGSEFYCERTIMALVHEALRL